MGITAQVFAVEPALLDRADDAQAYVDEIATHRDDAAGLWLDKSVMGIMDAFGLLNGDATPPASWLVGDQESPLPGTQLAPLTADQVQDVASLLVGVSDDEFRTMVASNEIVPDDADYLTHFFSQLRAFYVAAAANRQATLTQIEM